MATITVLEDSINRYAKKLIKKGHEVEVYVFRAGRNNEYTSASFVELTVDGDCYKFVAGEYASFGRHDITGDTWTEMKKEFEYRFFKA